MSDQAIVIQEAREAGQLAAPLPLAEITQRYRQMTELANGVMRIDVDYGVVPGTSDKKVLMKPGAEKLCVFFGLEPVFTLIDRVEDWKAGFFFYRYECALYSRATGARIGNAYGSCNSKEKKYRWRSVPEWKASAEEKAMATRIEERTNDRGSYKMYWIENSEPFDLVNTIDKMAQKRALVAAVLVGTGASEFFTQDLDDFDQSESQQQRKPAEKKEGNGNGNGNGNGHPATAQDWLKHGDVIGALRRALPHLQALAIAEQLADKGAKPTESIDSLVSRLSNAAPAATPPAAEPPATDVEAAGRWLEALRVKIAEAGQGASGEPSEAQRKYANSLISQILEDKDARDALRTTLVGEPSLDCCNRGQVKTIIDALAGAEGKGPSVTAQSHIRAIF